MLFTDLMFQHFLCHTLEVRERHMCDLLRINIERWGLWLMMEIQVFSSIVRWSTTYLIHIHEYIFFHSRCIAKINPKAPLNKVCILRCGVSTSKLLPDPFLINFISMYMSSINHICNYSSPYSLRSYIDCLNSPNRLTTVVGCTSSSIKLDFKTSSMIVSMHY